ncbi:hypothetical protein [Pontibacter pamirensis]|uniref:hypothetical protein n=1 Tax=Pontibacter pamirensis TaxID=2562824 RepID=UPI001389F30C|nr:hypothetical protein [Pontibacter pamirensis]
MVFYLQEAFRILAASSDRYPKKPDVVHEHVPAIQVMHLLLYTMSGIVVRIHQRSM